MKWNEIPVRGLRGQRLLLGIARAADGRVGLRLPLAPCGRMWFTDPPPSPLVPGARVLARTITQQGVWIAVLREPCGSWGLMVPSAAAGTVLWTDEGNGALGGLGDLALAPTR